MQKPVTNEVDRAFASTHFRLTAYIRSKRSRFMTLFHALTKSRTKNIYLPFYRKKWKRITLSSRTASITHHVVGTFGERKLSSLTRDELRNFFDDRKHLAFSMADHLRWDLKQILDLAIAEGLIHEKSGLCATRNHSVICASRVPASRTPSLDD